MEMTEKATHPEAEYDEADTVRPDTPGGERGPKRRIDGGTLAWLNVLAGFCIFVNSW